MRRYRHNPASFTAADLLGLVQQAAAASSGATARDLNELAAAMRNPTFAEMVAATINNVVAEVAAKKAEAEAAAAREAAEAARVSVPAAPAAVEGELTDSRAWAMLADLVTPSVLPDLTDEERSALRAAFMEESRKAA